MSNSLVLLRRSVSRRSVRSVAGTFNSMLQSTTLLNNNDLCAELLSNQTTRPAFSTFLNQPTLASHSLNRAFAFPEAHNCLSSTAAAAAEPAITADVTGEEETYPNFRDIPDLDDILKLNLEKMRLETMTEIQAKTYQAARSGADVLGRARTGTGKTIAYLLPAFQQLLSRRNQLDPDSIHMLVLVPTRELAVQIDQEVKKLLGGRLSQQVIFGGGSTKPNDVAKFNRRVPDILVATPGRLRDHLQSTDIKKRNFGEFFGKTSILVLDEVDRLLDMGFRHDVDDILSYLPSETKRQTFLFSATLPRDVKAVVAATLKPDFMTVDCIHDTDPASHTNAQVEQTHVIVPSDSRLVTGPVEIILRIIQEARAKKQILKLIAFFNTAHHVAFYSALFNQGLGIKVMELHSRKKQSYRNRVSNEFRGADAALLFTSDVSARGVDYPNVTNVVQVGIADSREAYIHRLGRTGRAGKVGEGLLVLTEIEHGFLNKLEGLDVPVHSDMQRLIESQPDNALMERLEPIFTAIQNNEDERLIKAVEHAYRSMLGFYSGKLTKLGDEGPDSLVRLANNFAKQVGLRSLPEIDTVTVAKMGLSNSQDLNIVNVPEERFKKRKPQKIQKRSGGRRGRSHGPMRGRASFDSPIRY